MRKLYFIATAFLLLACGDEPGPDRSCEGESEDELCLVIGAHCGVYERTDRCGRERTIDCGTCDDAGCEFIPTSGVCAHVFEVERCERGEAGERVVRETCAPGEICVQAEDGARCAPLDEDCGAGYSYCTPDGNLVTCKSGEREEIPCEHGCSDNPQGPRCREARPGTVRFRGQIHYEHNVPNEERSGWGWPEIRPAAGLRVVSYDGGEIIDTTVVGEDGVYESLVREEGDTNDALIFMAYEHLLGEGTPQIGVANPDLAPGGTYRSHEHGPRSTYWAWTVRRPWDEGMRNWVVNKDQGATAIQIFQGIRRAVRHVASHVGLHAPDLTAWYQPGVDYECGTCFIDQGAASGGGHIIMSGGSYNAGFQDLLIYHEAGHYAFASLGVVLGEAGRHCPGVPAPPGQAFSEGHASWYALDRLKDPTYFQEYAGTFYTMDVEKLTPPLYFEPPRRSEGVLQEINELWVSALLWHLAKEAGSSQPLHAAMMAPEMRGPFTAGYVGKYWSQTDAACRPIDPQPGGPTPVLADYLDALVCSGFPEGPIQGHVEPHYPFDATEPTCKAR